MSGIGFVKVIDGNITVDNNPNSGSNPQFCFYEDYAGAQADVDIITPTAGKKIEILSVYVSTKTVATDVTLSFKISSDIFFKLYTSQRASATGNVICSCGDTDEIVKLTCGAGTFISIAYNEVD